MTAPGGIVPLPATDWSPELAPVLEDQQGSPLNIHALMAHHPQLLKAWWTFRNHGVTGGTLGRRAAELVILRVALHIGCWYEWASHVDRALSCGLTLAEIGDVVQGAESALWPLNEALLLQAVDELMFEQAISKATLTGLDRHYDLRQIMDLIAIQGMYLTLGGLIRSLGLELDEQVRKRLPPTITRKAFAVAVKTLNQTRNTL